MSNLRTGTAGGRRAPAGRARARTQTQRAAALVSARPVMMQWRLRRGKSEARSWMRSFSPARLQEDAATDPPVRARPAERRIQVRLLAPQLAVSWRLERFLPHLCEEDAAKREEEERHQHPVCSEQNPSEERGLSQSVHPGSLRLLHRADPSWTTHGWENQHRAALRDGGAHAGCRYDPSGGGPGEAGGAGAGAVWRWAYMAFKNNQPVRALVVLTAFRTTALYLDYLCGACLKTSRTSACLCWTSAGLRTGTVTFPTVVSRWWVSDADTSLESLNKILFWVQTCWIRGLYSSSCTDTPIILLFCDFSVHRHVQRASPFFLQKRKPFAF